MMKRLIAGFVMTIAFAAAAQAGQSLLPGGVIVTDLGAGLTAVGGNMVAVRSTDDDVQNIGCRVRAVPGADASVVCAARDIDENVHLCFSFDPALVATAQSISPYSYISYQYNESAECTDLLITARSNHLPDALTEKSKVK
jgi:hypothetical protein